ncbi:hypothetical protein [Verrucomicrobium sp. BvORR106]|uniref:hypothetical protein n=1 Tax=Verrucomicrobium sp. BvORR106 TaxID=1403819 RepID=UPI00056DA971|nr:hypothetical protein [Verrucomicrobium sp. BvORR106]
MRSRLYCLFLIVSSLFVLMTMILPVLSMAAKHGVNDEEWTNIQRRGLPSNAPFLTWTSWEPANSAIATIPAENSDGPPAPLIEYRIGTGQTWLFDFNFYQGRYKKSNGQWEVVPAHGPLWGVQIHWHWTWIALGLTVLTIPIFVLLKPAIEPSMGELQLHT